MSPTDDNIPAALGKKPARRSISASDFRLPKPYRRKIGADSGRETSRMRVSVVVLTALPIAALVAALALIVHENAVAPHTLPVLVATPEVPPPQVKKSKTTARVAARAAAAAAAPVRPQPAPAKTRDPSGAPAPLPMRTASVELVPDGARMPMANDPDVDLIASILMLTPARQAALPCSALLDDGCSEAPQLEP
ncbi:MAG TPA: hypothetical protein VGC21_13765 [Telluria sp.]